MLPSPLAYPHPARHRVRSRATKTAWLLLAVCAFASGAALAAVDLVVNLDDNPIAGGGPDPVVAGGVVTYNVRIDNNGTTTATGITATYTMPATAAFVGIVAGPGASCSGPSGQVLTCTWASLGSLASVAYQVKLRPTASALAVPTITSTVSVSAVEPESNLANNVAVQDTTVVVGANLAIGISASPSPSVMSGGTLQYTLRVTNAGPDAANAIVITDNLPTGFVATSLPAACSAAGQTLTCNVAGPLAAGTFMDVGPIAGRVTVASSSTLTDAAAVSSAVADADTSDNTATLDTVVTPGSDVALAKSVAPSGGIVSIGDAISFTLVPSYSGDPPSNLTLTDTIPAQYSITSASPFTQNGWNCTVAAQTIMCTRASVASGAGDSIAIGAVTIAAQAISAGTGIVNTAIIASTTPDPNPANNTASAPAQTIVPPSADLRADKTGPNPALAVVGVPFTWTVGGTNTGPTAFSGTVTLTDTLPAGLTVNGYTLNGWSCLPAAPFTTIAGSTITCTRIYSSGAPLAAGASTPAVAYNVTAAAAGIVANQVCIATSGASVPDPNAGNDCATYAVGVQTLGSSADLSLAKSAGPSPVAAGDVLTYAIEVRNAGPNTASSVTVTDALGTLFSTAAAPGFVGASATGGGVCAPGTAQNVSSVTLSCSFAAVPVCTPGVNCPVITVQVRPGGEGGARVNTASVVSTATADPDTTNNSASVTSTVTPRADMTVSKNATPGTVPIGQTLTNVVTASNIGPSSAPNVTIDDALPMDAVFLAAVASGGGTCPVQPAAGAAIASGNQTLHCTWPVIAAGAQQTVTVTVRPALANGVGATLIDTVSVATTVPELDLTNNGASASAVVAPPRHDLLVNKTDLPDPVARGDDVVYAIRVTNSGPSYATSVVVTDVMPPAGISFQSADVSGIPGATCSTVPAPGSYGGTLVCNIGDLAAGAFKRFFVTMRGDVKGTYRNTVAFVRSQEMVALGDAVDPNLANNTVFEDTTVRSRTDVVAQSKTAAPSPVALRRAFTYTAIFANAGPGEADEVTVTDTLPAGMELTATPSMSVVSGTATATTCTGAAGGTSFTCTLGTLSAPPAQVRVTIPVRVVTYPPGGTITNTIRIDTTSIETDAGNNAAAGAAAITAAQISGTAYRDLDDSGAMSGAGETGIPGGTVTLTGTAFDGTPITLATTTDASGNFSFVGLPAGTYALVESPVSLPGFTHGKDTAGSAGGNTSVPRQISGIVLGDGVAAPGYLFAERLAGEIRGTVYEDLDRDHARGAGEPGIGSVTLQLTGKDGNGNDVVRTAVTASDGTYAFVGLPVSNAAGYTVTEVQPGGYGSVSANPGTLGGTADATGNVISGIVLGTPGATSVNNDFGEYREQPIPALDRWSISTLALALMLAAGAALRRRTRARSR